MCSILENPCFTFMCQFACFDVYFKCPCSVVTQFKAYYFEDVLRDVALFRSSMLEQFSVSELDRCQPSISMNLDSY